MYYDSGHQLCSLCGCKIEFQRQKSDLYVFAVGDHDSGRCSGNSDIYGSNEDGTSEFPFGLMLIYAAQNIAMGMFIMRGFFISLPRELEEAAMIDGCSRFGCFVRIIVPLARAGVATQVIFNGLTIWNDYFMANIMITKDELRTLPLSIANFVGKHSTNYPELFAMLTMATIPVIIVFVLSQKSFIEGVAAGAVKG